MNAFVRGIIATVFILIMFDAALCLRSEPGTMKSDPLHQRLKDPSPAVRKQAALTLAESNAADAIPVLIDLLAELPVAECKEIEEYLTELAGEWKLAVQPNGNDKSAWKSRRDIWRTWWRNGDGQAQLAAIRQHTPTPELRRKVKTLLDRLGDDAFAAREAADRELRQLGRVALPQLREAASSHDAEVARRVRRLIERIASDPSRKLPRAAVRLVALCKPDGATAALLAYFPLAEEENLDEEVRNALIALACRGGKLDGALRHALSDDRAKVRAVAAESLARGGGREGRAAARKLLDDKNPSVRLRVALALARAGDKDAVPLLIDLLVVLPDEEVGEVEETLYELAGDAPPKLPSAEENDAKQKRRDAWAGWWKTNAPRIDLSLLNTHATLGFTLLCDTGKGRVFEIDRRGKELWSIGNLKSPGDAVVLPGNRVLIAEFAANRISERDFTGKILWQKQVDNPVGVQRLANGNTLILLYKGSILEIDRADKVIYAINNIPGGVKAARRGRQGDIFYVTPNGECVRTDTTGKRLKSFATNHRHFDVGGLDLLPNGNLLLSPQGGAKLAVYNAEGKKMLDVEAPQAATATALANGHFLVASYQGRRVYEVDRNGKIVWEQKGVGHVYRARRR
jgi:HEAT repeat protein/outer membrane protein assembly factor BamB